MISKKASKYVKNILERINDIEKNCIKNGGVNFALKDEELAQATILMKAQLNLN